MYFFRIIENKFIGGFISNFEKVVKFIMINLLVIRIIYI